MAQTANTGANGSHDELIRQQVWQLYHEAHAQYEAAWARRDLYETGCWISQCEALLAVLAILIGPEAQLYQERFHPERSRRGREGVFEFQQKACRD